MNVEDTMAPEVIGDRLEMIFNRQTELFQKYHPIEKANGIGHGALAGQFDIDDPRCQYLCKDFAWRVTEEIAESTEAGHHLIHAQEEAADALHFLVELYLINGLSAQTICYILDLPHIGGPPSENRLDMLGILFEEYGGNNPGYLHMISIPMMAYQIVETLGRAMNCLKNKPWKQTQVLTDVGRYHKLLAEVLSKWVIYAKGLGMTAEMAYDLYFRKSNVNSFRMESKY